MAERPATCSNCGKRLSKKQWYYRNGQFFCKKPCWKTAKQKAIESQPALPAAKKSGQAGAPSSGQASQPAPSP